MEWNKVQFHREYSNNFHGKLWKYYGNILGGTIALLVLFDVTNVMCFQATAYLFRVFKLIKQLIEKEQCASLKLHF